MLLKTVFTHVAVPGTFPTKGHIFWGSREESYLWVREWEEWVLRWPIFWTGNRFHKNAHFRLKYSWNGRLPRHFMRVFGLGKLWKLFFGKEIAVYIFWD